MQTDDVRFFIAYNEAGTECKAKEKSCARKYFVRTHAEWEETIWEWVIFELESIFGR